MTRHDILLIAVPPFRFVRALAPIQFDPIIPRIRLDLTLGTVPGSWILYCDRLERQRRNRYPRGRQTGRMAGIPAGGNGNAMVGRKRGMTYSMGNVRTITSSLFCLLVLLSAVSVCACLHCGLALSLLSINNPQYSTVS